LTCQQVPLHPYQGQTHTEELHCVSQCAQCMLGAATAASC
jgi:hypothetical protein